MGAGPHAALLEISGATFAAYAERHGYDLDLRTEILVPERAPAWSKIRLFLELFEHYDLVLWIDADAAIVDPTLDIADELQERDLMALVAHEVAGQVVPNCGVWVLRRHRLVRRWLEEIWNRVEYLDHQWWENAAVIDALGYQVEPTVELVRRTRMRARTRFIDRSWNSIAIDLAPHPKINHYPGRSQEYRLEHLTADLKAVRNRRGEQQPRS